jgi:hypothetical protein
MAQRQNFLGALPYFIGDTNYMGARPRHHGQGGYHMSPAMSAAAQRANHAASFARPDIPGTPARDAALLPAAFPVTIFALANGTNIVQQTMNPQTPFRGQRLTSQVIRNGVSAATTAPVMGLLLIGQKPIITTSSGVPLETFSQNSFDTNILMPPSVPGVVYTMNLNLIAALTTTDTLIALVSIIGSAVL